MKNIILIIAFLAGSFSFGQVVTVIDTDIPFYGELISYDPNPITILGELDLIEITLIDTTIDFTKETILSASKIRAQILPALNRARAKYDLPPLKLDRNISEKLERIWGKPIEDLHKALSMARFVDLPLNVYGFSYSFNVASSFENKEEKFADYIVELLYIDEVGYDRIMNPDAKVAGVFYKHGDLSKGDDWGYEGYIVIQECAKETTLSASKIRAQILPALNRARAKYDLPPLKLDRKISEKLEIICRKTTKDFYNDVIMAGFTELPLYFFGRAGMFDVVCSAENKEEKFADYIIEEICNESWQEGYDRIMDPDAKVTGIFYELEDISKGDDSDFQVNIVIQ